jgi:hypothetical protein
MPQCEWTLKAFMLREISHKGPHIVWFHLQKMSRKGNFTETGNGLVLG